MKPVWRNSLGDEVDLDDIDKVYALNIYTLAVTRRAKAGLSLIGDPLIEKLRDVVLNGREQTAEDHQRAHDYNYCNAVDGLPFRAPVPESFYDDDDDDGETYENRDSQDDFDPFALEDNDLPERT